MVDYWVIDYLPVLGSTHPTSQLCVAELMFVACPASSEILLAVQAGGASWRESPQAVCKFHQTDGWVWRSAGCSREAAGTFGFRVIQESELQTDLFSSCQIQDEIMVGHKVKIEPAWVNKAARRDSINFCSAGGALGSRLLSIFFLSVNSVRSNWITAVWFKQTWAQRGVPYRTQTFCVSNYLIKHLKICTENMRVWLFFLFF